MAALSYALAALYFMHLHPLPIRVSDRIKIHILNSLHINTQIPEDVKGLQQKSFRTTHHPAIL